MAMRRTTTLYKAKTVAEPRRFLTIVFQSVLSGSLNRANTCAGSAIDALIGIDNIFSVFFGNAGYGAVVCAGSAADALFGINYIRHSIFSVPTAQAVFFYLSIHCITKL